MDSIESVNVGDYVRWLYPLGYEDVQSKQFSYGLVMDIKMEENYDGKIILLLDSGYRQSFWLSLDLLVELGSMEVARNGHWKRVR